MKYITLRAKHKISEYQQELKERKKFLSTFVLREDFHFDYRVNQLYVLMDYQVGMIIRHSMLKVDK